MKQHRGALTIANLIFAVLTILGGIGQAQTFDHPHPKGDMNDIGFYQPSSSTESYPILQGKEVRNIIFCIGDGMGLGQVMLARMKAAGVGSKLYMERMPVVGIFRTHSANALVTDSAAAGTALAAAVKTNNGMLGMTPDGKKYQTILEAAKAKGMATGLVATSSITGATPAAFASHVKSRYMHEKIAEHLVENKVNVLLGGGRKFFLPKSDIHSGRKDEKDLINVAKRAGYTYVQTAEELKSAQGPYLLGLFQLGPLTTKSPEPTLAQLTAKAIEVLNHTEKMLFSSKKGFFLMVEGSQIDWACHDNDANSTLRQTLLFDEAVKVAIEFALKDKRTLVVVTADHETGGLTIEGGNLRGDDLHVSWSTKGHSALPVPIYALGPRAGMFSGVYDNTEVPKKFAQLLGIKPFPKAME